MALKYDEELLERIKIQRNLNNAKIDICDGGKYYHIISYYCYQAACKYTDTFNHNQV